VQDITKLLELHGGVEAVKDLGKEVERPAEDAPAGETKTE